MEFFFRFLTQKHCGQSDCCICLNVGQHLAVCQWVFQTGALDKRYKPTVICFIIFDVVLGGGKGTVKTD